MTETALMLATLAIAYLPIKKCNIFVVKVSDRYMQDPDLLIQKIVSGDTDAFQLLIETYQRLVSHIVFRMVHNKEDREDISQEVFIQVYRNLNHFKFEAKLSTWISRIAYNRCINYLEKKKVLLFDDESAKTESVESVSSNIHSPAQLIEEEDIKSRLQLEIEKLPLQFRTILTLYHLDEMKYNEIAEIMGLPVGTVKSYLFRARKLLKERLMVKYQVEELV